MADDTNDTTTGANAADTTDSATDTTGNGTNAASPALPDGGFVVLEKPGEVLSEQDARAQAKAATAAKPGTPFVAARIVYEELQPISDEQETVDAGA